MLIGNRMIGVKYPSRSDYCSAIRNPQFAFRKKDPQTQIERDLDASLVKGKVVEKIKPDGRRELWSASGSFAIAFKFETFSPQKLWAIRCFTRTNFEVNNHYKKALIRLQNSPCRSYFVDFEFLEEGIRVQGNCYPLLKMEWVEGDNLKKFIKANLGRKNTLKFLADEWLKLSQKFLNAGIAHGDLQHGNILIVNRFNQLGIKLIDYDSLYFAGDGKSVDDNIKGLSDYQHPLRKSLDKRCLEIDFFPQLVIYLSILALAEDPHLWEVYQLDKREGLLFSQADFQNPQQSSIFQVLARFSKPIATLANQINHICQLNDFSHLPSLESVLSGNEKVEVTRQKAISPKPIQKAEVSIPLAKVENVTKTIQTVVKTVTKAKFTPTGQKRHRNSVKLTLTTQQVALLGKSYQGFLDWIEKTRQDELLGKRFSSRKIRSKLGNFMAKTASLIPVVANQLPKIAPVNLSTGLDLRDVISAMAQKLPNGVIKALDVDTRLSASDFQPLIFLRNNCATILEVLQSNQQFIGKSSLILAGLLSVRLLIGAIKHIPLLSSLVILICLSLPIGLIAQKQTRKFKISKKFSLSNNYATPVTLPPAMNPAINFVPSYLSPITAESRRRPGPSLNKFRHMVNQEDKSQGSSIMRFLGFK